MNPLANAIFSRPRHLRSHSMQFAAMAVFVIVVLALFLVSRTFGPESHNNRFMADSRQLEKGQAMPRARIAKAEFSATEREAYKPSSVVGTAGSATPVRDGQPLIASSGEVEVLVKNLNDARLAVEAVISRHHGYLAQLHVDGDSAGRSLVTTVRVPAQEFAAVLQELKSVGQVERESQTAEEVSQPYMDLSARLHNAQETETRLQDVLQHRAGKMSDILEVEEQISRVRGEIEAMQAELRGLNRRITFSSIALTVREQYAAQFTGAASSLGNQLRNASVNGLREAWLSLLGIVLFLMTYGPGLLLWMGILFFPARFLFRKWRQANWTAVTHKAVAGDAK
jgi:hypothetical protein